MELNADRTVTLPAMRLPTPEVDQLLHDLAQLRNQMAPVVPQDMRELGQVVTQHNPHVSIARGSYGLIVMGVRHRALGWCLFTLDQRSAASIRDALAKRTSATLDSLDEEIGDADRSH